MSHSKSRLHRIGVVIVTLGLAAIVAACDDATPTAPTATTTVTATPPAPAPGTSTPNPEPVAPGGLVSLSISPQVLRGGDPVSATVTLNGAAPAGGTVVAMASNSVDARPPASVTVLAGASSVTFPILTYGVSRVTEVTITATLAGLSQWVQIRLEGVRLPGGGGGVAPVSFTGAPTAFIDIGVVLHDYALLASTAITCTGSTVTGDIGVSPGTTITGFGPCVNNGAIRSSGDAATAQSLLAPIGPFLAGQSCLTIPGSLDNVTLAPGVYCLSAAATNLTGVVTLSGSGYYVFRLANTLVTTLGSQVLLTNGAVCDEIGWQVPGAVTIGGSFTGNIVAASAITVNPAASLAGRALTTGGAVTISGTSVSIAGCS